MCTGFPLRKIEFWWSIVHIFVMVVAGVVSLIGLSNLSGTILEDEVIATSVFCFLGEFCDHWFSLEFYVYSIKAE